MTEIIYGINSNGNLYLGNKTSGYNLPDTFENRAYIALDYFNLTGNDVDKDFFDPDKVVAQ